MEYGFEHLNDLFTPMEIGYRAAVSMVIFSGWHGAEFLE